MSDGLNDESSRLRPLPEPDEDGPQDFTPITNFADMGPALSEIRHVVRDMKPKVDKLVEHNASHEARIKASESRLRRVEDKAAEIAEKPQSHDCAQAETIREIKEEAHHLRKASTDTTQRVVVAETKVGALASAMEANQNDTKSGRRWLVGIIVTLAIVIGGAAIGWVITLVTVRSDVAHLASEQQEIQERLSTVQVTTTKAGVRVEAAAKRIETVAQETEDEATPFIALDDVWCNLSGAEREKLRRALPSDRLPARRCQ